MKNLIKPYFRTRNDNMIDMDLWISEETQLSTRLAKEELQELIHDLEYGLKMF